MVLDQQSARPAEQTPLVLWVIALAALAPFPIASLTYVYGGPDLAPHAMRALLTYSTVVLAFLGGVRWGLETGRDRPRGNRLLGSIVSPLAAWTLYLVRNDVGPAWTVAGFLCAFLLQWLFDHRASNMPARYPRLSTTLTAGACVSLALAMEQALHA